MRLLQTYYANAMAYHEALHLSHLDISQALHIPSRNEQLAIQGREKIEFDKPMSARVFTSGR